MYQARAVTGPPRFLSLMADIDPAEADGKLGSCTPS